MPEATTSGKEEKMVLFQIMVLPGLTERFPRLFAAVRDFWSNLRGGINM